jgi:hypothetical protein
MFIPETKSHEDLGSPFLQKRKKGRRVNIIHGQDIEEVDKPSKLKIPAIALGVILAVGLAISMALMLHWGLSPLKAGTQGWAGLGQHISSLATHSWNYIQSTMSSGFKAFCNFTVAEKIALSVTALAGIGFVFYCTKDSKNSDLI